MHPAPFFELFHEVDSIDPVEVFPEVFPPIPKTFGERSEIARPDEMPNERAEITSVDSDRLERKKITRQFASRADRLRSAI